MAAGSVSAEASIADLITQAFAEESVSRRAAQNDEPQEEAGEPAESLLDEALDEDAEEDDTEAEESVEPEDETPATAEAPPTEEPDSEDATGELDPKVAAWAELLVKNPKNLTQIPQAKRADAITAALRTAGEAAGQRVTDAATQALITIRERSYQEGYERARVEAEVKADYDYLEALEDEDPQVFAELGRKEPSRVRRYYQLRENGTFTPPDQQPQGAVLDEDSQRELAAAGEIIKANPAVKARLAERESREPKRYAPGPAGLARLIADTQLALAAVQAEEAKAKDEPVRIAAEQRRAAAVALKDAPKAAGGGPRGANGAAVKTETLQDVLGRIDWSTPRRK